MVGPVEFPWEEVAVNSPIFEQAAAPVVTTEGAQMAVIEDICDEHQIQAAKLVSNAIEVYYFS